MSIPDAHFPVLLTTLIRSRFQVKPATLLIPIDIHLFLLVEEFHGIRYWSGSYSLLKMGSGFHWLRCSGCVVSQLYPMTLKRHPCLDAPNKRTRGRADCMAVTDLHQAVRLTLSISQPPLEMHRIALRPILLSPISLDGHQLGSFHMQPIFGFSSKEEKCRETV